MPALHFPIPEQQLGHEEVARKSQTKSTNEKPVDMSILTEKDWAEIVVNLR